MLRSLRLPLPQIGLPDIRRTAPACILQRDAEWLCSHFCAAPDFAHSPATCLVETLIRFHTFVIEIPMIRAASSDSLCIAANMELGDNRVVFYVYAAGGQVLVKESATKPAGAAIFSRQAGVAATRRSAKRVVRIGRACETGGSIRNSYEQGSLSLRSSH
jgi:hypothetical protein